MIYYLSKFLPLPFYPIGLSLVLTAGAVVLLWIKRRNLAIGLLGAAALQLWFFSTSAATHLLARPLESRYENVREPPKCSTIVLLGGGEQAGRPPIVDDGINDAGDRILHAARLYKKGLAPRIVASAGYIAFLSDGKRPMAEVDSVLLVTLMGVDPAAVICEKEAKNTYDHGFLIRRLLERKGLPLEIIVVTSAWHMPRAAAVMRKAGFKVHPAPTDFRSGPCFRATLFKFMPSALHLAINSEMLKEYYGLLAYRILGWI